MMLFIIWFQKRKVENERKISPNFKAHFKYSKPVVFNSGKQKRQFRFKLPKRLKVDASFFNSYVRRGDLPNGHCPPEADLHVHNLADLTARCLMNATWSWPARWSNQADLTQPEVTW